MSTLIGYPNGFKITFIIINVNINVINDSNYS